MIQCFVLQRLENFRLWSLDTKVVLLYETVFLVTRSLIYFFDFLLWTFGSQTVTLAVVPTSLNAFLPFLSAPRSFLRIERMWSQLSFGGATWCVYLTCWNQDISFLGSFLEKNEIFEKKDIYTTYKRLKARKLSFQLIISNRL